MSPAARRVSSRGRQAAGSAKKDAELVRIRKRRHEVVRLRTEEFLSWPKIGEALGISHTQAQRDFDAALAEEIIPPQEREARRQQARAKLAWLERQYRAIILKDHFAYGFGKPVFMEVVGEDEQVTRVPVLDDGPKVQAGNALVKLWTLEARIDGTFAPQQVEQVTPEAAREEFERRCRELGLDADEVVAQIRASFKVVGEEESG